MAEVEATLAVKPAKLRPIIKTGDVLMDKAEMKTSLANMPQDTQHESSKKEMDTRQAATPTNVQIDNSMQSKEMDETQMSVAKKMPAKT